jgi:OOP family OmpA-OmpF porin
MRIAHGFSLRRLTAAPLLPLALCALGACGGPVAFSGNTALAVVGDPPPPLPPEPKRVEVKDDRIQINEKIQFDFDKATIKEVSHSLLNEVVDVIKKNPHIKKIAIEGHASAEGGADYNLSLSDRRAKAVMKYLVDHGIVQGMLTAQGFGATKPLGENDTEPGREKNRRVEFNIVEQDPKQKTADTAAASPMTTK